MNHSGDTNKMVGDTPRTDGCLTAILDADGFVDHSNCPQRWVNHGRELERELNAANDRIKRLEDAGIELRECASWVGHSCCQYADQIRRAKAAIEAWDKESQ